MNRDRVSVPTTRATLGRQGGTRWAKPPKVVQQWKRNRQAPAPWSRV